MQDCFHDAHFVCFILGLTLGCFSMYAVLTHAKVGDVNALREELRHGGDKEARDEVRFNNHC